MVVIIKTDCFMKHLHLIHVCIHFLLQNKRLPKKKLLTLQFCTTDSVWFSLLYFTCTHMISFQMLLINHTNVAI